MTHRRAFVKIADGPEVECFCSPELAAEKGDLCVVEADGLHEFGEVTGIEDVETPEPPAGNKASKLLRRATLQDQAKASENALMGKMAMDTCAAKAAKLKLPMRLVHVRYSFDRAVLMTLFTAEDRVDFREMVKELTAELHTRVEMKQIGVRDEAAIIGGMGPCGRALCCGTWLRRFAAVNVKAVKTQNISLNPAAITGMCGRLKCCLRYEYDTYKQLGAALPRVGSNVRCPDGKGCVVGRDILAQRVRVRLEDQRALEYGVAEVKDGNAGKEDDERMSDEDTRVERAESELVG